MFLCAKHLLGPALQSCSTLDWASDRFNKEKENKTPDGCCPSARSRLGRDNGHRFLGWTVTLLQMRGGPEPSSCLSLQKNMRNSHSTTLLTAQTATSSTGGDPACPARELDCASAHRTLGGPRSLRSLVRASSKPYGKRGARSNHVAAEPRPGGNARNARRSPALGARAQVRGALPCPPPSPARPHPGPRPAPRTRRGRSSPAQALRGGGGGGPELSSRSQSVTRHQHRRREAKEPQGRGTER